LDHRDRDVESLGHDHGRDVEAEEGVQRSAEPVRRQRGDERDLGLAEHLDAAVRQPFGVPGEDEAGAGQVGLLDDAVQAGITAQQLEREALLALLEEIADSQHLHRAATPFTNESTGPGSRGAERSRMRSRCRWSCVLNLDRTWSSAERASAAVACAMIVERPVTKARTSTAWRPWSCSKMRSAEWMRGSKRIILRSRSSARRRTESATLQRRAETLINMRPPGLRGR